MKDNYTVRLVARNEGIEYRDDASVYRFNVRLTGKKWVVYLPCSKGDFYQSYELTEDEQKTILPRIVEYLESRKYFGIVGPTYPVEFERVNSTSAQVEESRRRASTYWHDEENKAK